jgi:hypothetical protein
VTWTVKSLSSSAVSASSIHSPTRSTWRRRAGLELNFSARSSRSASSSPLAGLQGQRVEASSSTVFRFASCSVLVGHASGEGFGKGQVRYHRLSSTVSVFALCEPRPQAVVEGRWSKATCFSSWTVGGREGPIRSGPPC